MFAFALWDREQRLLSLVRDRFGEKPLYYGWVGKDLLFASELKAMRRHPRFAREIDGRALGMFAARSYIPAPLSIYRGIFKLEPGCILTVGPDAAPRREAPRIGETADGVSLTRYWSYKEVLRNGLRNPIRTESDAITALESVLARAVGSQSLADVPVGAFLSGGIDSSSVVALYQKYSSRKVRTFTIGFNEEAYNEADHAREVAAYFGTEHHERIVTPDEARDVIPRLPQIYDEPFADSSQIPTFLVSGLAREQVKVALSGDAGDELFGGYSRYHTTARLWGAMKRIPAPLRSAVATPLAWIPAETWGRIGTLLAGDNVRPYFGTKARMALKTIAHARNADDIFRVLTDEWAEDGSPVRNFEPGSVAPLDLTLEGAPDAARMMYCDAVTYLPDDILCKVDRASMAVSLEVHCPFLDHRFAELAARIPMSMKIRDGSGKHILREMLYREAPRRLFERPKSGFGIPVGDWIKGPLREWAEALLDSRRIRSEGWFDADLIERRWREHLAGKRDSTGALWAILMFQAWVSEQTSASALAA
jgi:asparagine synthase (glutamine-hydrolysing)